MLIISFPTPLELDYIILQIPFKSQRNSPLRAQDFPIPKPLKSFSIIGLCPSDFSSLSFTYRRIYDIMIINCIESGPLVASRKL